MSDEYQEQQEKLTGEDLLRSIEQQDMKDDIPEFRVGDSLEVSVIIPEGGGSRTQPFRGTCIARKGNGNRETFTVRRLVQGEGVERTFPLHSPHIQQIKVLRRGKVRRSKLYYLRERTGRAAVVETEAGESTAE